MTSKKSKNKKSTKTLRRWTGFNLKRIRGVFSTRGEQCKGIGIMDCYVTPCMSLGLLYD